MKKCLVYALITVTHYGVRLKRMIKKPLDKYSEAYWELSDLTAKEYFTDGFRLGARFMMDTFLVNNDSNNQLN